MKRGTELKKASPPHFILDACQLSLVDETGCFMKAFDRYVLREILPVLAWSLVLSFLVLAFLQLAQISDSATGFGVTGDDLIWAVAYSLPPALGILIPIGTLTAVLLTFGRLQSEREILGYLATGGTLNSLLRTPLLVAVGLSFCAGLGTVYGEPWGVTGLRELMAHGAKRSLAEGVEPGVFYKWTPELTFYARAQENGTMTDWLLSERSAERNIVVSAKSGALLAETDRLEVAFEMQDGVMYTKDGKGELSMMTFSRGTYRVDIESLVGNKAKTISPVHGLTLNELWEKSQFSTTPKRKARYTVAFHRKWSFPLATIIFAALAVPVGILVGIRGRGVGVVVLLTIVASYYYVGRAAELSARALQFDPVAAAWLPNFVGIGLFLPLWFFAKRRVS